MATDIEISGLAEIQTALYSYSNKMGDYVIYKALRAGANLVKKEIQKNAPVYKGRSRPTVKSGTLRKGFRVIKSKIHSRQNSAVNSIGVFITLKPGGGHKDPNDPYYAGFINNGFKSRPGTKFIDNAFNSTKSAAADLIISLCSEGADLLAKKEGL
jgi:HK97 gp10 family phage protein